MGYWQRLRGWMGRRVITSGEGLLLAPAIGGIHTFFLGCPIDIAYLDERLGVVDLQAEVPPWRLWMPRRAGAVLALELPAGQLALTQTQIGDLLEITLVAWR